MTDLFEKILSDNLITPYLEIALRKDDWPDQLIIPLPEHGSKTDFKFHPSSHCLLNERELYYLMHPDYRDQLHKRQFAGMDHLSMIQGTIFHVVIQQKLKQEGWLTDEDIEIPMHSKEHNGTGHLDFLWRNHPTLGKDVPVDIKTASKASFDSMYKPYASAVAQVNCYMDWGGWDEGVILVVEAGRPFRMKEFRVLPNELILHQVYSKWKNVREAVANNTPPPLCAVRDSFCTLGSDKYKGCPARTVCVINDEQGRN